MLESLKSVAATWNRYGRGMSPTLHIDWRAQALLQSLNSDSSKSKVEVVVATYTFQVGTTARSSNCPKSRELFGESAIVAFR